MSNHFEAGDMNATGSQPSAAEALCLACGMCCNGAIFGDVKLQQGDNADRLRGLGLVLRALPNKPRSVDAPGMKAKTAKWHFAQPCSAHDGCACRIYSERPEHCRNFRCALLKRFDTGGIGMKQALATVGEARQKMDGVRTLLEELGDRELASPIRLRFRRTSKRVENEWVRGEQAETFAQLTQAMHEFNLLLSRSFYPGD
jgi:hypothetical protein